jgi:hypothetical protein
MRLIIVSILLASLFYSCEPKKEEPKKPETPILQSNDKALKILWLEEVYDEEFQSTVFAIKLNEDYFSKISDAEKAVIAYYATFHGNECWWDGDKPNDDRSNLNCKIISALNLGYQCSDTHLDFLRKWFRNEPKLLAELDYCPTLPNTSTLQDSFEEIYVERSSDYFTIRFNICAVNLRENLTRCYEENHTYRLFSDAVEEVKGNVF